MTYPNPKNFCGGNFQDWLEVNLIEHCNAHCTWCIERDGYHPTYHAPVDVLIDAALATNKTNIILLGGEPTLYPNLAQLIHGLSEQNRRVWITTNGSRLNWAFVWTHLSEIYGVNISLHHYKLDLNRQITGLRLHQQLLSDAIAALHNIGATVRLNCNVINGYIDSATHIRSYIAWAKQLGADNIRFAELKNDKEHFVDLAKLFDHAYGLNNDPFTFGCHTDCVIDGMPVNFRQMCGLQTALRIKPICPVQYTKDVLYYDGKIYQGWQTMSKTKKLVEEIKKQLTEEEIRELLCLLYQKEQNEKEKIKFPAPTSNISGCMY